MTENLSVADTLRMVREEFGFDMSLEQLTQVDAAIRSATSGEVREGDESIDHHAYRVAHIPPPIPPVEQWNRRAATTPAGDLAERLEREARAFESDSGSDPEADAGTAKLLREAATALRTQPEGRGEVRVKPLEWEPDHVGGGLKSGEYRVRAGVWTHGYYWTKGDEDAITGFEDEDAAKAAAEADYRARILSCLEPTPPAGEGVTVDELSDEHLRWIAESKDTGTCRARIRAALRGALVTNGGGNG